MASEESAENSLISDSNFEFVDDMDVEDGRQSPLAQSSSSKIVELLTEDRDRLNRELDEQKREFSCQLKECKQEKTDLKQELRQAKETNLLLNDQLLDMHQRCRTEITEFHKLMHDEMAARAKAEDWKKESERNETKVAMLENELRSLSSKKSKVFTFDSYNSKRTFIFDCEINDWRQVEFADSLQARTWFALASIGCRFLISGGSLNSTGEITNDCQLIDVSCAGAEENVLPMLTARKSHCSLAISDKIYAFGGQNLSGDLSSIECFDEIGIWTVKGQMRTKRFGAGGAVLDGVAYAIGGYDGEKCLNTVERFDSRLTKCEEVAAMGESRQWVSAAGHNGKIYVAGGRNGWSETHTDLSTVEIYDPRANRWMNGPNLNTARRAHSLVSDWSRLMAIGGFSQEQNFNTMEVLVPNSTKWTVQQLPFNGSVRAVAA